MIYSLLEWYPNNKYEPVYIIIWLFSWILRIRLPWLPSYLQESVAAPQAPKDNATLYHYFPHNQHLFQLPDCASQQVGGAGGHVGGGAQ